MVQQERQNLAIIDSPYGGDATESCGGSWFLNLYSALSSSSTTSAASSSATGQCIAEGTTDRALNQASYTDDAMTPSTCQSLCMGYMFAGVEYSAQCCCGFSFENGANGDTVDKESCNYPCGGRAQLNSSPLFGIPVCSPGNDSLPCGGYDYINLYSALWSSTTSSASSNPAGQCIAEGAGIFVSGVNRGQFYR
ncbi:hypothetical protein BT96DRAFT_973034 [Gymnopus androsaceus JB14]|uniref:WSC domain-containing protein n=1 Tax=Gymnopus androsaceus JB14 TaxID=1447944 RepID=A0A6A4I3Q3_9AGAR|nr:hypothetical protein BT96DRAFT_973034 [Gymnopus androsaceus JB14]